MKFNMAWLAMSYKIENSKCESSAKKNFGNKEKNFLQKTCYKTPPIRNASLRVSCSALDWLKYQSMISIYSELSCRSVQTESEEFIIG